MNAWIKCDGSDDFKLMTTMQPSFIFTTFFGFFFCLGLKKLNEKATRFVSWYTAEHVPVSDESL